MLDEDPHPKSTTIPKTRIKQHLKKPSFTKDKTEPVYSSTRKLPAISGHRIKGQGSSRSSAILGGATSI